MKEIASFEVADYLQKSNILSILLMACGQANGPATLERGEIVRAKLSTDRKRVNFDLPHDMGQIKTAEEWSAYERFIVLPLKAVPGKKNDWSVTLIETVKLPLGIIRILQRAPYNLKLGVMSIRMVSELRSLGELMVKVEPEIDVNGLVAINIDTVSGGTIPGWLVRFEGDQAVIVDRPANPHAQLRSRCVPAEWVKVIK